MAVWTFYHVPSETPLFMKQAMHLLEAGIPGTTALIFFGGKREGIHSSGVPDWLDRLGWQRSRHTGHLQGPARHLGGEGRLGPRRRGGPGLNEGAFFVCVPRVSLGPFIRN